MTDWTVMKLWHVEAERPSDAIEQTQTVPHTDVRATVNGPFDWLPFQREELDALLACIAATIPDWQLIRDVGQAEETRRLALHRYSILNSLRTYLTEARWRLMTPEQVEEEEADLRTAQEEGVIGSAVPTMCRHCRVLIEDAKDLAEGQRVTCVPCGRAGRTDR